MSTIQTQQATTEQNAQQELNPSKFFETMFAYQSTSALTAAIDLDLFSAIFDTSGTVAEVANRVGAPERGVRALCDFLVVRGFLTKDVEKATSHYALTPETAMFLRKKSRAYLGTATRFMASEPILDAFKDLAGLIRFGGPHPGDVSTGKADQIWIDFAHGMAPVMFRVAQETAKLFPTNRAIKVLDVAAGHGMFGIQVALRNPEANIVALDWKSVLTVAGENAARFHVSRRFALLPGDALEIEIGTGYDGVIVANFLHHLDKPAIIGFLKKLYAAMAPGGRVVLVEFAPNQDRVSPPVPAAFVLNMVVMTAGGDAYSFPEYQEMLRIAGFSECEVHPLLPSPELAIVGRKAEGDPNRKPGND
jgi:ubiquinone/menaquinone biosynthesis C-methylase UbiE